MNTKTLAQAAVAQRKPEQVIRWRRIARGAALPLAVLIVWSAAFRLGVARTEFLASPEQVWSTALRLIGNGYLLDSLSASLRRDLIGFVIGATLGLGAGALLGFSRLAEKLFGPSFHTVKQVSLLAWIPLISLWFGLGDPAKVAFLSLAAFFPMVLNTFEGIRSVPRELFEVARVFEFSRWQLIRRVVLPSALPSILTGVQLALMYSWVATLGAEYLLTSGRGIGNLMVDGREHFWMDQVILGVIVVGIVGYVLNVSAIVAEKRLLRWRGTSTARFS
ncbi:MAG: ABC transporter permease [Rhodocyclaceae bacterium]